jgi:cytochrome c oxidase cbb3-type subunit 3
MQDPLMMKDASATFRVRCVQCHAERGQGNIGPNLTDEHWLYGSASLMELYEVIANGRPLKGMPTWSKVLRPVELAQVVAYVGTLRNSNVPGRPPQGTRVTAATATGAPEPVAPQQHVTTAPAGSAP